jgi:hypothetical protein
MFSFIVFSIPAAYDCCSFIQTLFSCIETTPQRQRHPHGASLTWLSVLLGPSLRLRDGELGGQAMVAGGGERACARPPARSRPNGVKERQDDGQSRLIGPRLL